MQWLIENFCFIKHFFAIARVSAGSDAKDVMRKKKIGGGMSRNYILLNVSPNSLISVFPSSEM